MTRINLDQGLYAQGKQEKQGEVREMKNGQGNQGNVREIEKAPGKMNDGLRVRGGTSTHA